MNEQKIIHKRLKYRCKLFFLNVFQNYVQFRKSGYPQFDEFKAEQVNDYYIIDYWVDRIFSK